MANTTEDKLRYLIRSKEDVRLAIERMQIPCPEDTPFLDYGPKIKQVDVDLSDATVTSDDLMEGIIAYDSKEQRLVGTIPDNGALNYNASDFEQDIPKGYTSGGTITADITKLTHYKKCLGLASEIMTGVPHHKYVQYIGNSNNVVWMDTGVKLTSTIGIEATIRSYTGYVSGDTTYWGFLGAWANNDGLMFGRQGRGYYIKTGASNATDGKDLDMFNFHTFVYDPINNIYTLDGTNLDVSKTNGADANIYLFCANGFGYGIDRTQISSCKIYDNGVLIRDYVPIVRAVDNVICMYDKVTETYIENKGSGGYLTAGPEITE